MKFSVGIDEAGRGPLAGPVAVGVVRVLRGFDWGVFPHLTDSKQMSERRREDVFAHAKQLQKEGALAYAVAMVGAGVIDREGIARAIATAMARAITTLKLAPAECFIKLDGSLSAPAEFQQQTIIKGDVSEPEISLASVMAKVTRDRYMVTKAREVAAAPYDFARHKGYGTRTHRAAIAQYGFHPLHRLSYCKNIEIL